MCVEVYPSSEQKENLQKKYHCKAEIYCKKSHLRLDYWF